MLNHDELLPEEQAYPVLVQQLQATYQMKPEEKQVLIRVHERLAKSAHPLPALEPLQTEHHARPQQLVSSTSTPVRPTRFRSRWLEPLNTLAAVLFIALLVGSLVLTFSIINRSNVGSSSITAASSIHLVLVSAKSGKMPSQAQMEATRTILSKRFKNFGLDGANVRLLTVNGQPRILVNLPHFGGNEQQIISILLEKGELAFWDTGPGGLLPVPSRTPFDASQYREYNPGGMPHFTNQDLDLNTLTVNMQPLTGTPPQLNFMMKGDAIKRFQVYTTKNIGHALTITLDGKVITSEIIVSAIAGPFAIEGKFTQQDANALVAVLKYGPLPVELKKLA